MFIINKLLGCIVIIVLLTENKLTITANIIVIFIINLVSIYFIVCFSLGIIIVVTANITIYIYIFFFYLRQEGYVFAGICLSVCLFVCLSVCKITQKLIYGF